MYLQNVELIVNSFIYLFPYNLFSPPRVLIAIRAKQGVLNILFKLTTTWTLCLVCKKACLEPEFILWVFGCAEMPAWPQDLLCVVLV